MFQVSNGFLPLIFANIRMTVCHQLFMLLLCWIRANFVASCEKSWHMSRDREKKTSWNWHNSYIRFRCWIFQKFIQPTLRKQMVLVYIKRAATRYVSITLYIFLNFVFQNVVCIFTSAKSSSSEMSVIGAPLKRWSPLLHRLLSLFWSWLSLLWSFRFLTPEAIKCPLDDSDRYDCFWLYIADCDSRRHWLLTFTYSFVIWRLWCDALALGFDVAAAAADDDDDNILLPLSSCCSWWDCACLLVAWIDFDIARAFDDWYTILFFCSQYTRNTLPLDNSFFFIGVFFWIATNTQTEYNKKQFCNN